MAMFFLSFSCTSVILNNISCCCSDSFDVIPFLRFSCHILMLNLPLRSFILASQPLCCLLPHSVSLVPLQSNLAPISIKFFLWLPVPNNSILFFGYYLDSWCHFYILGALSFNLLLNCRHLKFLFSIHFLWSHSCSYLTSFIPSCSHISCNIFIKSLFFADSIPITFRSLLYPVLLCSFTLLGNSLKLLFSLTSFPTFLAPNLRITIGHYEC